MHKKLITSGFTGLSRSALSSVVANVPDAGQEKITRNLYLDWINRHTGKPD